MSVSDNIDRIVLKAPQKTVPRRTLQPIAVVAGDCRLPGAESPEALWQALMRGESSIAEAPETWLDPKLYYDPQPGRTAKTYTRLASIFDEERIGNEIAHAVFPNDFRSDDPVLKLAYLVARKTVSETILDEKDKKFGIYLGGIRSSNWSNDHLFSTAAPAFLETLHEFPAFRELEEKSRELVFRRSLEELERRYRRASSRGKNSPGLKIADFVQDLKKSLGWTGPAYSLDAACSSSLIAVECACNDLREGRVRGALVGAVSSMSALSQILFSKNFASATKMCCPFDRGADGTVGSMGIAFVFLKTLEQARNDGDAVWGVIRNVAYSTDGRGKTFWAPKMEGQALAIRRAYEDADLNPLRLNYIEAQANSSGVGDTTELKTIDGILSDRRWSRDFRRDRPKTAVGSAKAHFGHAFEAAGLVSLLKVLQIIRHRTIPPQINISRLNEYLSENEKPFFVPLEEQPLPEPNDEPGLFGINAFGVGGINAHLVLEEPGPLAEPYETAGDEFADPPDTGVPVAVVGLGCVYPGAYSAHAFRDLLDSDRDPKTALSARGRRERLFPLRPPQHGPEEKIVGGFIDDYQYDYERHRLPPLHLERSDPLQTLVLGAADEALAGRTPTDEAREDTFVVLGADHDTNFFHEFLTTVRGAEIAEIVRENVLSGEERPSADFADSLAAALVKKIHDDHPCLSDAMNGVSTAAMAARITKTYDFHGGAFCIDGGSFSSSLALDYAVRKIRREENAIGICGGAYRWTNPHAYEYHTANHPVTAFPLAEGAGVVLLKALSRVDRKTETPYALVLATQPVSHSHIDMAFLESVGIDIEEIAFVSMTSPHLSEHLSMLDSEFRAAGRRDRIPVTTCRDRLGNLVSGAGTAELIAACRFLDSRTLPAPLLSGKTIRKNELFYFPESPVPLESEKHSSRPPAAIVLDLDEHGNGMAVLLVGVPKATEKRKNRKQPNLRPVTQTLSFPPDGFSSEHGLVRPVKQFRQVGSHYEMGFALGIADADNIARVVEAYEDHEPLSLTGLPDWDALIPDILGQDGFDELRGLADGSGVAFEALLRYNLGFHADLSIRHFPIRLPDRHVDRQGNHVANFLHVFSIETPLRKILADELDVHLLRREPMGARSHELIGATGCIGGWAGFNSLGIAVSISQHGYEAGRLLSSLPATRILGKYLGKADSIRDKTALRTYLSGTSSAVSALATNFHAGTDCVSGSPPPEKTNVETWDELVRYSRHRVRENDHLCCAWMDRNVGFRLIAPF